MFKMIETMDMNSTIRLKDAHFINDEETFTSAHHPLPKDRP